MKCPYCGSENVEAVKSWEMPKMGYKVTHYRCKTAVGSSTTTPGRAESSC